LATSIFNEEIHHFLREFVPDTVARCVTEADPFVAMLWAQRENAVGDPLDFYVVENGYTSLGNYGLYSNYYRDNSSARTLHATQEWVTLSATARWSKFLDEMSEQAGSLKRFDRFKEEMGMIHEQWANDLAYMAYGNGGIMTVPSAPPHTVEMIDGLDLAVGTGTYANLSPAQFNKPACWQSYLETLTGAVWLDLVTPGTSYYLPQIVSRSLRYIQRGTIRPNLILCDSVTGDAWRYIAEQGMQIVRTERLVIPVKTIGELGFEVVTYRGIPIWPSPTLDIYVEETGVSCMYILNTNYFKMLTFKGREFNYRGPTHLEAMGEEIAMAWVFAGQLRCMARRHQAKICGMPVSGPDAPEHGE
jgi:hypothetical protein